MRLISLLLLAALIAACARPGEDGPGAVVASVRQHKLYANDVKGIVPSGTPAADSIRIIQDYVDNWIRQQLMLDLAEQSLSEKQKDMRTKLEEYRRSLVIFEFESQYVQENLDTMVSQEEIEAYYQENLGNFELKENIVKVLYVKVVPDTPDKGRLRTMLRSDREEDRIELEEYCVAYAVNYFLDDQIWLYFNDLLKEIPIQAYNQESFLENNRFVEIADGNFEYFVRFMDFRIREGVSPLSLEAPRIRDILINKRKLALLSELRQRVFREALEKGEFTVHGPLSQ